MRTASAALSLACRFVALLLLVVAVIEHSAFWMSFAAVSLLAAVEGHLLARDGAA